MKDCPNCGGVLIHAFPEFNHYQCEECDTAVSGELYDQLGEHQFDPTDNAATPRAVNFFQVNNNDPANTIWGIAEGGVIGGPYNTTAHYVNYEPFRYEYITTEENPPAPQTRTRRFEMNGLRNWIRTCTGRD